MKTDRTFLFSALICLFLCAPSAASPPKERTTRKAPRRETVSGPVVSCEDGLLTLRARNADLKSVLEKIEEECGVTFENEENAKKLRLNLEFEKLDMDDAAKRIIEAAGVGSYALKYRKDRETGREVLSRVLFFSETKDKTPSLSSPQDRPEGLARRSPPRRRPGPTVVTPEMVREPVQIEEDEFGMPIDPNAPEDEDDGMGIFSEEDEDNDMDM